MMINILLSTFLIILSAIIARLIFALHKEPINNDVDVTLGTKICTVIMFTSGIAFSLYYVFFLFDAGLMSVLTRYGSFGGGGPYAFSLIALLIAIIILFVFLIIRTMRLPR